MKKFLNSGVYILLILSGLYILYLRECRPEEVGKDEVIVKKALWQSVLELSHKPPVIIVKHDTVKGPVVYVNNPVPKPKPDPKDSTINNYEDSLVKKDVSVRINLKVKGQLLDISWHYRPIVIIHDSTIIKYVPQIVDNPVPIPKRGFFVYSTVGGNKDLFLFGAGINYITKKNTLIGYEYERLGDQNVHSAKLGFKLGR